MIIVDRICGTYFDADSWHILTSTQAKEATTDHYIWARRIFPSAFQDPSYSTGLHWNLLPGCDSSFWRFPRFRRHTYDPQWSGVRADTEMTTTVTVCRSLLPLYGRRIHDVVLTSASSALNNYCVSELLRSTLQVSISLGVYHLAGYVHLVGAEEAGSIRGGGACSMRLTNFYMTIIYMYTGIQVCVFLQVNRQFIL